MSRTRVDDFLDVVRNPDGPSLEGSDPVDDALRTLMVHLVAADGILEDAELTLGLRLFPRKSSPHEALAALRRARERTIDPDALLASVPDPADRHKLVQFAQHVATEDGVVQAEELEVIVALRASLADADAYENDDTFVP